MDDSNKTRKMQIGRYLSHQENQKAFTLFTFPPQEGFFISPKFYKKHEEAIRLIGELDGSVRLLPDKNFFITMFIKKEATYSCQIEDIQATLQDAVTAQSVKKELRIPGVDTIEGYSSAINYALEKSPDSLISLTLMKELHEKLMVPGAASNNPNIGEFRRSQNWIGGKTINDAVFIPPAVEDLSFTLNELEKFIYADDDYPTLIKAAFLHAQFETIHPFENSNGPIGRMLITLYLYHKKLLDLPVLYLSKYFKKYQNEYYQKLNEYHDEEGTVDSWLDFFLDGVIEVANDAISTCANIANLHSRDIAKLQKLEVKSAKVCLDLLYKLYCQPIISVTEIKDWTGYTLQKSHSIVEDLLKLGILEPLENTKSGQKYVYGDYYELFDELYRENRSKTKK